jgi:glycosyltransferase involved in cell wall biosynthesis
MPLTPIVSVIMIFLNGADFLREAIESVLSQSFEHWELVLVDDGSTDGSSKTAMSYVAKQPERIVYLEHEGHQNLGMSAARNLGIQRAKGKYIAFLDADDYWLPGRLEAHVRLLDETPSAGMLFGSTRYWFSWTGKPGDQGRDYLPLLRVLTDTLFSRTELLPLLLEEKIEIPSTCSILVRSDVAKSVGGFEDSFRGMYEDQVFYAKVCLATNVLAVNDCLAWYRQHPKSHVSIAMQSEQPLSFHFSFLKWLESYCRSKHVSDQRVLRVLRRQLWLYDSRSPHFTRRMDPYCLRWLKKWILRVEGRLLPRKFRDWLWIRSAAE